MIADSRQQAGRGRALFPRPVLLAGIFAVLAALLLADLMPRYAPGLLRFEHAMGDVRTSLLSDQLPSQHPHVAVLGITDLTLANSKARLPIDRALLARLVDAVDAAGAKAIGIDVLFVRIQPAEGEEELIEAIRRAKAKVVLAAADERVGLSPAETERQAKVLAAAGRPAGYANFSTERDWVVRFKAPPAPGTAFPKSFARLLAESAGTTVDERTRRIAWLRDPEDRSDTFLTIPGEVLLRPAGDPLLKSAQEGLKDKIVIIGAMLPDVDRHITPLSSRASERMAGAVVHAHIVAEMLDGRRIGQLEVDSLALRLGLAALAGFGFWIGWRFRLSRRGLLLSSLATITILALDTFVFWQSRIILPVVLALMAWFLGEFTGHYMGLWLGHRRPERARWFTR
jgi:CHASE2 domain-containing sensor protein